MIPESMLSDRVELHQICVFETDIQCAEIIQTRKSPSALVMEEAWINICTVWGRLFYSWIVNFIIKFDSKYNSKCYTPEVEFI